MTNSTRYTASVISMRNCQGTGEWDLYLCDPLPQHETLADTIRQCFAPLSVMKGHFEQGAVPTMIEIRSQDGLVALADVNLESKPFKMNVIWRDELSQRDAERLEQARVHNLKKTKKVVFDVTDVSAAEGGAITVKYLTTILESQKFVEPIEATMKIVYQVERALGKQANRVQRLEDELGL